MPAKKPAPRPRRKPAPAGTALPSGRQAAGDRRALGIFLRQTREFRPALALHNDPVQRDNLVRDITAELAGKDITVLTLDLLARVQETIAQAPPGQAIAVMVVNLESRTDYSPELARPGTPANTFLTTANLHRELFAKACPGPLVIWMTELLERALVTQAPDLWH